MTRTVNVNGHEWELFDAGAIIEPAKRGRPFDERLAALDDEAANEVIGGRFVDDRAAAKQYAEKYVGSSVYRDLDREQRRDRIKTVERRIQRRRLEILST
ncbi:hypothetical protein J4558_01580 [Leptolyngbya sp. 15MV]|nr:hypothetical protein J4558_01580 [Leptolyngbya sp. 15MV]